MERELPLISCSRSYWQRLQHVQTLVGFFNKEISFVPDYEGQFEKTLLTHHLGSFFFHCLFILSLILLLYVFFSQIEVTENVNPREGVVAMTK